MALPVNILELVHGKVVEWERLEFKEGWNPEDVLHSGRVIARDYRNRRIGDFLKELNLTEGKATGIPVIHDEMTKNGNPEPIFYTDNESILFLVTLPCHTDWLVTKSVTKSGNKLTPEDVDVLMAEKFDFQLLSILLDNDLSDIRDYVRDQIVTKSMSKSVSKSVSKSLEIIDFLIEEKSRIDILAHLGLINHSKHFNYYIKPLLEYGIIEMTLPDKPNSRLQKYRLTEKGKKLLK